MGIKMAVSSLFRVSQAKGWKGRRELRNSYLGQYRQCEHNAVLLQRIKGTSTSARENLPAGPSDDAGCGKQSCQVFGHGMGGYGRSGQSASLSVHASSRIQVNCLSPGYVDTDMNQGLRDDDKLRQSTEGNVMLKRISKAEEQAGAVLYFLSDFATCEYCPLES
jgi:hypothetical protein